MAGPNAIVASRPEIWIDGNRREALEGAMLSLSARWTQGLAADLEIEFSNWGTAPDGSTGFTLFGGDIVNFGKKIEIKLGGGTLFSGRILSMAGRYPEMAPPALAIAADDGLQDLRMTRRTRSFERASDADIFRQIANDYGLQCDTDVQGGAHPVLVQANQSDLAFLRGRALACDLDLWLENGALKAKTRASRTDSGLELKQGSNLLEFRVTADLAHQRTALVVGGWDVSSKQAVSVRTDSSALSRIVDPSGKSGPQILQQAIGDRVETIAHIAPWDDNEARGEGKSRFCEMASSFVRGRARTVADARLAPGRTVKISDVGPWFAGVYGIAQAEHRFDQSRGLWTEIVVERAWMGG